MPRFIDTGSHRAYYGVAREDDMEEPTEKLIYQEMSQEESTLDWHVTTTVMSDRTLMKTLEESQSQGEKHAVIARVENGVMTETYISPESAVKRNFPFNAVEQAFQYYDARDGVCLVIVRNHRVAISVNGLR
jgi:hypothetical protein